MSNFVRIVSEAEARTNEYIARVYRVRQHLDAGERRAALRRLEGLADELVRYRRELEMPMVLMILGSQAGFFSGRGNLVRGRLPAAVVGGALGWLYGQAMFRRQIDDLGQLLRATREMERALAGPNIGPVAASGATA